MSKNSENLYIPKFLKMYRDEIMPKLKEEFGIKNDLAVPHLKKIVVNMGLGAATSDAKIVEKAALELAQITGQKAKICRARKPISNFKLRKDLAIGCCVTMRQSRMYEFLERLICIAMPRIRDFRGVSVRGFDSNGNYNFGLTEQTIFQELDIDKVTRTQGMNISIHTSAKNDEQGRRLLEMFGFPFKREEIR